MCMRMSECKFKHSELVFISQNEAVNILLGTFVSSYLTVYAFTYLCIIHNYVFVTRFAKRGLMHAQFQVSLFTIIQQIQQ